MKVSFGRSTYTQCDAQVREATLGRSGWVHMGSDICYYRNSYQRVDGRRGRSYHTTTFSIKFPHSADVCYIAYHYPYTFTQLLVSSRDICEGNANI